MRIFILGTRGIPSGYSGYETFAGELCPRLVARGHEVTVYAHSNMFPEKNPTYKGVKLIYLPSLLGKNTSQFSNSLLASLNVGFKKSDLVLFVNCANGPFGILLRLFGKTCAINVDGMEWLRPKWRGLGQRYFRFGAWASTKFFNQVITDAKGMQDFYESTYHVKTVDIAYGADLRYSEKPELVKNLGLEPNGYYLIASRMVPDNNADIIIKGFLKSKSKRILAIAGGTVYKNPYEDYLRSISNERVKFLGFINDQEVVKELHCNAYAYTHGHEFGGTNPSILKGLAYGNAILALDTVFNREVLDDGKYGLLWKKNEDDFAAKVNVIEDNEEIAKNFRSISRNRITERYTWEHITDQYEELFKKMTGKS
jgi:glycosyltransferase involved in cell wall biosynthesis